MTIFTEKGSIANTDVVQFFHLRIWAERGLIHIEDSRDNSYVVCSVKQALLRMYAVSEMLGRSSVREQGTEDQFDRANRRVHQNMVDDMCHVVRRAKEQGMPSDASASRDLARRARKTVVVSTPSFSM